MKKALNQTFIHILLAIIISTLIFPPSLYAKDPKQKKTKEPQYYTATPKARLKEHSPTNARIFEAVANSMDIGIGPVFSDFRYEKIKKTKADIIAETTAKFAGKQAKGFVDHFRTILIIWVITGVQIVKLKIREAKLEGKIVDTREVVKMCYEAALDLINSGEIWGSFAGSSAFSFIFQVPLWFISVIIMKKMGETLLAQLISSGIHSFIIFIGWELGGQLVTESCNMVAVEYAGKQGMMNCDDENDQYGECTMNDESKEKVRDIHKRCLGVWTLLYKAISSNGHDDYSEDREILGQALENMWSIFWEKKELRDRWLYNTWRLRMAKGDFLAIVMLMSTAGVVGHAVGAPAGAAAGAYVGSAVCPIVGTIAGVVVGGVIMAGFAVVAGLIHASIDEKYYDAVTRYVFDGPRSFYNKVKLWQNTNFIDALLENYSDPQALYKYDDIEVTLKHDNLWDILYKHRDLRKDGFTSIEIFEILFKERKKYREHLLNVYFEGYYRVKAHKENLERENKVGEQTIADLDKGAIQSDSFFRKIGDNTYVDLILRSLFFNTDAPITRDVPIQELIDENKKDIEKLKKRLLSIEEKIREFYMKEKESFWKYTMTRIIEKAKDKRILAKAALHYDDLDILDLFLDYIMQGLYPDKIPLFEIPPENWGKLNEYLVNRVEQSLEQLDTYQMFGYREKTIVDSWRAEEEMELNKEEVLVVEKEEEDPELEKIYKQVKETPPDEVNSYYDEIKEERKEKERQEKREKNSKRTFSIETGL